jgi:hypothetical protein
MSFLGMSRRPVSDKQSYRDRLFYMRFHASVRSKTALSRRTRVARMRWFLKVMDPQPGQRIMDLGGVPTTWDVCPVPLDITILNLPGTNKSLPETTPHRIRLVDGDARDTGENGGAYDIVFSNSVIEHVGGPEDQRRLAAEARRLAPRYWVQTPSMWFPIEAHTVMPCWWAYPAPVQRWFIDRWRKRVPDWAEMIEETTVLTRSDLREMFPDATLMTERVAGFPKSYVVYKR